MNIDKILKKFPYNRLYIGKIINLEGYGVGGVIVDTKELYLVFSEQGKVNVVAKTAPFILEYDMIYDRNKGKFVSVKEYFGAWESDNDD